MAALGPGRYAAVFSTTATGRVRVAGRWMAGGTGRGRDLGYGPPRPRPTLHHLGGTARRAFTRGTPRRVSEMATDGFGRERAVVLGVRAQDQDLGGHLLEHPLEVIRAQALAGVRGGRDDDAVDGFGIEHPLQRVAVGASADDARVDGHALAAGALLDRLQQRHGLQALR